MTVFGMTAALLAGIIAALSTYAVQSIQSLDPIFKIQTAATFRSSAWARSQEAMAILESEDTGRCRILMAQLQGHLFFGNVATLSDTIKTALNERRVYKDRPLIVILDFTLVVGMDSSAAHAVAKLKGVMHRLFDVEVTIFVSGSHRESFPCDCALVEALGNHEETQDFNDNASDASKLSLARRSSIMDSPGSGSMKATQMLREFSNNRVCHSLDEALEFAEDVLIARVNPSLLDNSVAGVVDRLEYETENLTRDDEKAMAARYMQNLAVLTAHDAVGAEKAVADILAMCEREVFHENEIIWKQGAVSDSMKILVTGKLVAYLDGSDITEFVNKGSTIGELGLVQGTRRLSTVQCASTVAVTYTLTKSSWKKLVRSNPTAARLVDQIVIRYLSLRVQHVSNRIFETRCLPI